MDGSARLASGLGDGKHSCPGGQPWDIQKRCNSDMSIVKEQ